MGVLILCIAILPFLGVGGMQVFRAEMTGPSKDRLTPRITTTAKLLCGVYILISLSEVLLYILLGNLVGLILFVILFLLLQQVDFLPDLKV